MNDPEYRRQMNAGLQRDRSAGTLAAQYELEKQPFRARREPEPERAPEVNRREEPPAVQREEPPVVRREELQQPVV